LLFSGQGIFGVVDFSGQAGALRCRAENLTLRAAQLGMDSGYRMLGRAAFGWVDRKSTNGKDDGSTQNATTPVAVAGEIFTLRPAAGASSALSKSYEWLVDGYRAGGGEFLSGLDGAFALALWREAEQRLILMTDRCGDGKLYYKKEADGIVFSSWLKLLGGPHAEVDGQSVLEFLRFLYITPPRTIYHDIRRIEPGTAFDISPGSVDSWEVHPVATDSIEAIDINDDEKTLQEFQRFFETSIHRRVGARRVGVLLSSGVDSATLLAGCDQVNPGQVKAFTVGFDSVELDEANRARAFANCLRVSHTTLRFNLADYRTAFAKMAAEFDQPFADPACLPLICAAGVAKERVEVLCDGSGSDGLFGSEIARHLKFGLEYAAILPRAARQAFGAMLKRVEFANLCSYGPLFDFDDPEELFITWPGWSKRDLQQVSGRRVNFDQSGFYRAFRAEKCAEPQQRFDAVGRFPPDDARFEAAAMAKIPIALPYHDVDLANFIRRLPQGLRFIGGTTKILLRRLFGKYYADYNDIVQKRYFTFPLHSFVADQDYDLVRRFLSAECLARHGLVDPCRTAAWIDRYLAGDQSLLFKVWSLLILHSWMESRN
jgi:asparagine synthase (glutamine-hydrolysing)